MSAQTVSITVIASATFPTAWSITNEIQIHDTIGNATLIGGQAIRLRLNLNFHSPNIAGYHLYNASSQLITILPDYNLALTTAQTQNS
jgi:hypothetical protein